jgi:hypothetical protein
MVELINTDLSQPLPNNSMHSPNSHYPMYQQQPMIASPNQQQPQAGQQLQQPSPASKQGQPSPQQQSLQRQSLQPGGVNASPAGGEQRSASPAAGSSTTVQASSYSMTHEGMQYQVQGENEHNSGVLWYLVWRGSLAICTRQLCSSVWCAVSSRTGKPVMLHGTFGTLCGGWA